MMGLEPTTFCMASKTGGNDPGRHITRQAAFLHGVRVSRNLLGTSLHKPVFGRLGHEWGTAPGRVCREAYGGPDGLQ